MTGSKDLSDNFPASREENWRALVGDETVPTLAKVSDDGIALGPIHVAHRGHDSVPGRRGAWTVIQPIEHPDIGQAIEQIEAELDGGAGGLSVVFAGSAAAARTGFGLPRGFAVIAKALSSHSNLHLRLEGGFASYADVEAFLGNRAASTTFAFDPLAEAAAAGGFPRSLAEIEDGLLTAARSLDWHDRDGAAAIADGRVWHAAGGSEAQELAGILGSLGHYVRLLIEAGVPPASAVTRIGITIAAGAHTLMTIATLRAARLVHARFVEALGLSPLHVNIHAETSWRMMTRRAPHLNILRTTSAALGAGIGGADSISVLPFSVAIGLPDAFARRIARNSQIILLEESGMARVEDPGGGSGTIEAVTAALAEKAWAGFRAIEAEGGLYAALRSGSFQRDIAATRDRRATAVAGGGAPILGVTAYPATEEKTGILVDRPSPAPNPAMVETILAAPPVRLAAPFEN
jgi:methylmalonyl-CoA mutase